MKKALRMMARFVYRMIYLVFALMLILSLLAFGSKLLNPNQALPGILGYSQLVVVSGSMQPAIDPGDLLIIKAAEHYQRGDIVTFKEGQSLVTHRLLSIEGTQALTQGDANNTQDPLISSSQIQGKVVLQVPKIGFLVMFLKTRQGMMTLAALFLILIVVHALFQKDESEQPAKETNT